MDRPLFALFARDFRPSVLQEIAALVRLLLRHGARLQFCPELYDLLSAPGALSDSPDADSILPADCCERADRPSPRAKAIVSIGGDGTFLQAACWNGSLGIPMAGLNGGHLGYLTSWRLGEYEAFARAMLEDDYAVEHRGLIEVEADGFSEGEWPYALNEVALLKENTASMISVQTRINAEYLTDYLGDGLIVATPTGSTGYNLSVGGPILEPNLRAWVLSPVAPHSLNMRPLVVGSESELTLQARSRSGKFLLSLDGRSFSFPSGSTLAVRRARFTIPVIRSRGLSFSRRVREKLLWGISPADSQASSPDQTSSPDRAF